MGIALQLPAMRRTLQGQARDGGEQACIFRDLLLTDLAAGAVNNTAAEPGPGTRTVTDTNGKLSIAGRQVILAPGGVAEGDPRINMTPAIARAAGVAMFGTIRATAGNGVVFGLDSDLGGEINQGGFYLLVPELMIYVRNSTNWMAMEPFANGTDYQVATILRGTGCHTAIKGGAFTDWKLLSPNNIGAGASVYAAFETPGGIANAGRLTAPWGAVQLPAPWASDYGVATQRLAGARAESDAYSHTADGTIEFTLSALPVGSNLNVSFRKQDATNFWAVTVGPTGGLWLYEVVNNVWTSRGALGAGTVAGNQRVVVRTNGQTIRVYTNHTLRITYALAANFIDKTAGAIETLSGGGVADLVSWPYHLSGDALAILNAFLR